MHVPISGRAASTARILALAVALTMVAAGTQTPAANAATPASAMSAQQAVDSGAAQAADSMGVTTYAAVIDRRTGDVIARTDNADTQVASESLVKVLLAGYYLVSYDGRLPADLDHDLRTMIINSDDDLCSAYWTDEAVPAMKARYHLPEIANSDQPGHWGSTKVSALDMAEYLYRMSNDPLVGPWLISAMQQTSDYGSDGYDQNFGFNTIDGAASKQGWGSDNWSDQANAVHSIGLTERYAAAVLQTGPYGTYRTMGTPSTVTARLIADAAPPKLPASRSRSKAAPGDLADATGPASTPPATTRTSASAPAPGADPAAGAPDGPYAAAAADSGWWRRALRF